MGDMTCPRCGGQMTLGAPHGPWTIQKECHQCGHIVTEGHGD